MNKQNEWYKKPWGMVVAVLLFPLFIVWYAWAKSKWSKNTKLIITAISAVILITAMFTSPKQETKTQSTSEQKTTSNSTSEKQNTEEQVAVAFDIPSLLGKNIDQLRTVLGNPTDSQIEPNGAQSNFETWDNTFKKGDYELLATYNPKTRVVEDLFLSTDDPSGQTKDKNRLLKQANVKEGSNLYKIEFVKTIKDPAYYTGIKVSQK